MFRLMNLEEAKSKEKLNFLPNSSSEQLHHSIWRSLPETYNKDSLESSQGPKSPCSNITEFIINGTTQKRISKSRISFSSFLSIHKNK